MSDFLDKLIKDTNQGDYRNLRKFLERQNHVIRHDRFDESAFHDVLDQAGELRKISEVGDQTLMETFSKLIEDAYYSLFKADPKPWEVNKIMDSMLLNHAIMERGMDLQEWEELRTYCTLDEWSSAMATISFSEQLEEIAKEQKELFDQAGDMQQMEQDLQDSLDQLESMMESFGGGPGGMPANMQSQASALQKHIQNQLNKLLKQREDLRDKLKAAGNELRKQMRQAMKNTLDEMKNESDFAETWGTDPGQLQRLSYKERFELGMRVRRSNVLKKLASLVGRVKRLAMGEQAKKIIHGRDEVHDIEFGNDLTRVVVTEFAQLADEATEWLFMKRFAEHGIMQYELRGTEKVGRGPIIVVIDSSGSMGAADKDGYTREMWGRAVGLALLDIAKTQGRNFSAIIFGSAHEQMVFKFPKGAGTVNEILDFAEYSFMGGTAFAEPLSMAMEMVSTEFTAEGRTKADIVFISDGCCNVTPEWLKNYNEQRDTTGVRIFGIMIGSGGYSYDASGWGDIFQALCDTVTTIEDISGGEDARMMFNLV